MSQLNLPHDERNDCLPGCTRRWLTDTFSPLTDSSSQNGNKIFTGVMSHRPCSLFNWNTDRQHIGTKVCRYNWHSAGVMVGHSHTCLKYHRLWHAHTEAQGKNMTLVKRENCTVVKCFKTEYEFRRQSMHGILFRHSSCKVVKRCSSVHWTPPKLG